MPAQRGVIQPPKMSETPPAPRGNPRGVNVVSMKARGVVSQPTDRHKTRRVERPFLLEGDILRVENIDNVTWAFGWARKKWVVKPGETDFIPFPAVVLALGDPRSEVGNMLSYSSDDGTRGVVLPRYDELCRLFARYGIEQENVDALVDFAPRLRVETMAGEPVIFPAQDPDMVAYPVPNAPKAGSGTADMRARMDQEAARNAAMEAELVEMRALISSKLGGDEPAPAASDEDEDDDALSAALRGGASADTGPQTGF